MKGHSSPLAIDKKLILLDRDGVINRDRPDSVKSLAEFEMIDGSAEAIARLNRAGLKVAVVTNQAVVGRGIISLETLAAIHQEMARRLWAEAGARVDQIFFAADAPALSGDWRQTPRRKPGPDMLREAMVYFNHSPEESLMIGDSYTDFQAASRANCDFWLVETGKGEELKSSMARDPNLATELQSVTICQNLDDLVTRLGLIR